MQEEDNDDDKKEELRACLDVVPRDDIAIDVEYLATKYLIVEWKTYILNENMMYYQIISADGSSKNYKIFSEMLDDFDRHDMIDLHRLINERYETTSLEGYDLLLWGDLKTLFEPNEKDELKEINIYSKGINNNVVGALMNVPIFVGTFFVVTDFAVLEDMDAYRDKGMGDVIIGKPFLREVGIKTKQFKGIITFYNGDDEVTYQVVQLHPRFKSHTNEQCNKIPPLLKVSKKDEKNGILHAYQKLKGFYKGALNLGPDYIRNTKMEKWLTRGHISMHEME
ncbi:hypothetical protein Tco_0427712 [Tanacetum coccineum]